MASKLNTEKRNKRDADAPRLLLLIYCSFLSRHSEYITGEDEGESAFVVQQFQLGHCAAELTGNRPKTVASPYRIGGISPVFRLIRRHTVPVTGLSQYFFGQ